MRHNKIPVRSRVAISFPESRRKFLEESVDLSQRLVQDQQRPFQPSWSLLDDDPDAQHNLKYQTTFYLIYEDTMITVSLLLVVTSVEMVVFGFS
jgi:hypothetical protein